MDPDDVQRSGSPGRSRKKPTLTGKSERCRKRRARRQPTSGELFESPRDISPKRDTPLDPQPGTSRDIPLECRPSRGNRRNIDILSMSDDDVFDKIDEVVEHVRQSISSDDDDDDDLLIRDDFISGREFFLTQQNVAVEDVSSQNPPNQNDVPIQNTPPPRQDDDVDQISPAHSSQQSQSSFSGDADEPIPCPSARSFDNLPRLPRAGVVGRRARAYPQVGFLLLTGQIIYGRQMRPGERGEDVTRRCRNETRSLGRHRILETLILNRGKALRLVDVAPYNDSLICLVTGEIRLQRSNAGVTTLTKWFTSNEEQKRLADAELVGRSSRRKKLQVYKKYGLDLTYPQYCQRFRWNKNTKKWTARERGAPHQFTQIGRMYTISFRDPELVALRLLLLHVPGCTSFDSIKTVDNEVKATFVEAAIARGLITTDEEFPNTIREALDQNVDLRECRTIFAYILQWNQPANALSVWNDLKDRLCQDIVDLLHCTTDEAAIIGLFHIQSILRSNGGEALARYDRDLAQIPGDFIVPDDIAPHLEGDDDRVDQFLFDELLAQRLLQLNPQQRSAFDAIVQDLQNLRNGDTANSKCQPCHS
ncbi:hypothetical protein DMENIID0001_155990 [Sergentomyia squamirostris]